MCQHLYLLSCQDGGGLYLTMCAPHLAYYEIFYDILCIHTEKAVVVH